MLWEMVVMLKLSHGKCFLLKVKESHFYLPLRVSFSHEYINISQVIKVCDFYNYILWISYGFYHLQKVRGLRWTDAVSSHGSRHDPAPHPLNLPPPLSSGLQICPDQTPCCCLHSLPSSPSQLPPSPSHSGSSFRSSDREQAFFFFLSAPLSLPNSSPLSYPAVLVLWGAPFSPLSVCTYWSLCPRARQGSVHTEGRWKTALLFPPAPPGGACAPCLPTAQWVHLWVSSLPLLEAANAGRCLSPTCSVPGPAPAVSSSRMSPPESLRAPVSSPSKTAAPLAFPSEHRSQCNSAFSTLTQCVPLYTVQGIVCSLDLWVYP